MFYPFDFHYSVVRADHSEDSDPVVSCLERISKEEEHQLEQGYALIKVNWFFTLTQECNCKRIRQKINSNSSFSVRVSPSFIAEPPVVGGEMQVALLFLKMQQGSVLSYPRYQDVSYARIVSAEGKWIFVGGNECISQEATAREKAEITFDQVEAILKAEDLELSNIVRQWNYIGDILGDYICDAGVQQHYQDFNNVRGERYLSGGLRKDFPAATGIGTHGNGIRIEFIAGQHREIGLYSLENPVQQDAHRYSDQQLLGCKKDSTPLFERGKVAFNGQKGHIWVSGTAAIRGEESVAGGVLTQTLITCENIDALVTSDNLIAGGLPQREYELEPLYIRGYVKERQDGPAVIEFLQHRYPNALVHVLQADVCRDELLVEIEAEMKLTVVS